MKLLDLFCGAGGSAMGYHQAGFTDIVGIDIVSQPNYPFTFIQADALNPPLHLDGFDLIHASPPCQRWAEAGADRKLGQDHPDYLTPIRETLQGQSSQWVIENIPTAPMPDAFLLCGRTFGLPIVRHRLFEASGFMGLVPSLCHQRRFARSVDHGPDFYPYAHGSWEGAWREHVLPAVWPWMTLQEAGEAIPPAYTKFIGEQFLAQVLV